MRHVRDGIWCDDAGNEYDQKAIGTGASRWDYEAAVAAVGYNGWTDGVVEELAGLNATSDGAPAVCRLRGITPGTIITGFAVKWTSTGASGGVTFSLVKRNERSTDTTWTLIGAERTATGAVTETTEVDLSASPEIALEGYSYALRVESVVPGEETVTFWAVGVQTRSRKL